MVKMSTLLYLAGCVVLTLVCRTDGSNTNITVSSLRPQPAKLNRSEILKKLFEGYDSKISPDLNSDGSTIASVALFVQSIDSIVEASMDYEINLYIRQSWVDERLSYANFSNVSDITIDQRNQDMVWTPDLFITNEKRAMFHEVTVPNRLMRLDATGRVLYSLRISVTASCPMDLKTFPLDTQVCKLQLESYGYSTKDLVFKWKEENPIDNLADISLPHFDLVGHKTKDCMKIYETGNFTCIEVEFHLTRQVGFYLIQIYVPSILVVALSWVNFWIDIEAVPARVSVGLLTVLTMTTQSSSSRQSMPKVSYVKAIDIWMSTCLVFVFAALLEFAVVNVYARKSKNAAGAQTVDSDCEDQVEAHLEKNNIDQRTKTSKNRAREVDKLSRKAFPLTFLIFNMIYWPLYAVWNTIRFNSYQ